MKHYLMCRPDFFEVAYEINPWMSVDRGADKKLALQQWESLFGTLVSLGAEVSLVPPADRLPDLVFTANAGLISNRKVLLSRFRFPERQGEEPVFQRWFEANGFSVSTPKSGYFEGAGDALFVGETLVFSAGFRSNVEVESDIRNILGVNKIIPLQLADPRFYHLDTCFCPLNSSSAFYYPGAFRQSTLGTLRESIDLIEVSEAEALSFCCNSVVVNKKVIMPEGAKHLVVELERRGFDVIPLNFSEFLKAGAAKCLTLNLPEE